MSALISLIRKQLALVLSLMRENIRSCWQLTNEIVYALRRHEPRCMPGATCCGNSCYSENMCIAFLLTEREQKSIVSTSSDRAYSCNHTFCDSNPSKYFWFHISLLSNVGYSTASLHWSYTIVVLDRGHTGHLVSNFSFLSRLLISCVC